MLKKLRKKFITVAMCSVFGVLALVLGIINTVNYVRTVIDADGIVALIKDGGGHLGTVENRPQRPISPETPFRTRFFTVTLPSDGGALLVNTDKIASIDFIKAVQIAKALYDGKRSVGFYADYRYGTVVTDASIMYIFVDCSKELDSFRSFLFASISVGAAAFVLIFALVFFLSGKVMKPVAESYAKQKRFITDASHEIKTPLTIIGANTDVLEMQGTANEWTEGIREQVRRLTDLTEKLVFLSRLDEANYVLGSTDFSISDAVEETIKPFLPIATTRGLEFECDIQKNITYRGDETLIRRLVSVLADNALKYSDGGGTISVSLKCADGKVRLSVTNPAAELRERDLGVLFERFYRGDKSRNSEIAGHGIGLSIASAVVSAHKGKISASRNANLVTFSVTLPNREPRQHDRTIS